MYTIDEQTKTRLDNNFSYHSPITELYQAERYVQIRDEAKKLAYFLCNNCPPSRELSLALTNLEDCIMWANAAIARNEKLNVA